LCPGLLVAVEQRDLEAGGDPDRRRVVVDAAAAHEVRRVEAAGGGEAGRPAAEAAVLEHLHDRRSAAGRARAHAGPWLSAARAAVVGGGILSQGPPVRLVVGPVDAGLV